MEAPERTGAILQHLVENYRADAVQFYDNNFFLREDDAGNWRSVCNHSNCGGGARNGSTQCCAIPIQRSKPTVVPG